MEGTWGTLEASPFGEKRWDSVTIRDLPSRGQSTYSRSPSCLLLCCTILVPLGFLLFFPEPHTNENYDQTTHQQCLTKMQTRTTFNTLPLTTVLRSRKSLVLNRQAMSLFPSRGDKWKIKPLEKSRKMTFNNQVHRGQETLWIKQAPNWSHWQNQRKSYLAWQLSNSISWLWIKIYKRTRKALALMEVEGLSSKRIIVETKSCGKHENIF